MKIVVPVFLTFLVGLSSVPYVYGFNKAFSQNPFLYPGICNFGAGAALLILSLVYGGVGRHYFIDNSIPIGVCVAGLVVANVSNYFVVTRFGASFWLLASLFLMLIPSSIVGYWILKERCNVWIVPCVVCALLTVVFFGLSKR